MPTDYRHCWNCGAEEPAAAEVCSQCGEPFVSGTSAGAPVPRVLAPPPPPLPTSTPPPPANVVDPEAPAAVLAWDYAFPLLTNRFVLLDFAKLLFFTYLIIVVLMGSIFLIRGQAEDLPPVLLMFAYCLAGLAVLFALIMLVFFLNRCPTHFEVGPEGVLAQMTSGRAKTANRVAVIAGLLAGSASTAGAGLLARSQEEISIAWADVYRVTEYPRQGVITLSNSWRTVIRLYCTPADYDAVATAVREYAARGAKRRQAAQATAAPSPVPRLLWLTLPTVLAGLLVFANPIECEPAGLLAAPLVGGLLVLWMACASRLLAVLTLGAEAGLAYVVIRQGSVLRSWMTPQDLGGQPVPEFLKYTKFKLLDGGEQLRMALAILGLLWIAYLCIQSLRGRLHPDEQVS